MRRAALRLPPLLATFVLLGGAAGASARTGDSPGGLAPLGTSAASTDVVPGELIVRFRAGVSSSARSDALGATGARTVRGLGLAGLQLVRLAEAGAEEAAAAELERDPRVLYSEPNYVHRLAGVPNDPLFPQLWGLHQANDRDIDAPGAWNREIGSPNVVVGVVDSGVAYGHPDLAPNIWRNMDEIAGNGLDDDLNGFIDDVRGWDFVQGDATPLDFNGHGSHVAGTIGARGNNRLGLTGVNQRVSIMPLRAGDADGGLPSAAIIGSFAYACGNGADIVNGSFGGSGFSQAIADAVTSPACANTLFVFAAGNSFWNLEGNTSTSNAYPCELHRPAPHGVSAPNVICVAATGGDDALTNFSNYGPTAVHLAAPGADILSAWPAYSTVPGTPDGFEGTQAQFDGRWGDRIVSGASPLWDRTSAVQRKGTYSLTDSPAGNYGNNVATSILRRTALDLTGRSGCRIDYWMRLHSEIMVDGFQINVGNTALIGWSGSTGGMFIPMSDDLSTYDGQSNLFLRFWFFSNATNNAFDGVYLDDLLVKCLNPTGAAYMAISGTSMASPHVAGVAALVLADDPSLSVQELKDAVLDGVDPKGSLAGMVETGGRLNAARALGLTPDDTRPNTRITSAPPNRTTSRKATFRFTSTEAGSTFECKLDGGKWTRCSSPRTYRNLKKGNHTFQARATDRSGNTDASPAKDTWKVV